MTSSFWSFRGKRMREKRRETVSRFDLRMSFSRKLCLKENHEKTFFVQT